MSELAVSTRARPGSGPDPTGEAFVRAFNEVRAELVRTQGELRREAAAHSETQRRLAYRETLPGWLRWPLGVARRRLVARS